MDGREHVLMIDLILIRIKKCEEKIESLFLCMISFDCKIIYDLSKIVNSFINLQKIVLN